MEEPKKPKKRFYEGPNKRQLAFLFGVIMLAFLGLLGRILYINVQKGEDYKKVVLAQGHYGSKMLPYQRGAIVDCNGTGLAVSKKVYNVVLDSSVVNAEKKNKNERIRAAANALAKYFEADSTQLTAYMNENPDSMYYVIKRELEYEEIEPFQKMVEEAAKSDTIPDVLGVWFEEEYKRYYPGGKLASNLIGYTNPGNAGAYGLEEFYNNTLNGTNGREYGYLNDDVNVERTTIPAIDGHTLVTTIDSNIQRIVEEKIRDYNEKYYGEYRPDEPGSKHTGCIVMKCDTAEVLAMACYPGYNLNKPKEMKEYFTPEEIAEFAEAGISDKEALAPLWRNFCISDTYEPGSVAKPFTVAMGLDSGRMNGNETYYCDGMLEVGGHKIRCHNRYGDGEMTVKSAIAQSCNISLMYMGRAIGKEIFLKYFEQFNFGLKTNIDLTGEARTASLVFNNQTMGSAELATSTFGQGFNVTMIEMITAFNSLVNGGYYYEPHVVKQILSADGAVIMNYEPRVLKQPISNSTSERVIEYCNAVVTEGTGKAARPAGYAIGGKTGTAEMVPRGSGDQVVSFMGYAPANDPEILVYVVIDRPNMANQDNGTRQACIIAREIFTEVLPYLNIFMTEELSESEIAELQEKGLYNANLYKPEEEEEPETSEPEGEEHRRPEVMIDPDTGYAIDPYTGEFLDPVTGVPINPGSSFMDPIGAGGEDENP